MHTRTLTLDSLTRAQALEPDDAEASFRVGQAYYLRREYSHALEPLRRAARLDPANPRYVFALGRQLEELGDVDGAIAAMRAVIALAPDETVASVALGKLYDRLGDTAGAIDAYVHAIDHARAHAAFEDLGYEGLHEMLAPGRDPEEIAALAAARVSPRADPVLMRIGLAGGLERHGRYDESIPRWQSVVRDAPSNALALTGVAAALMAVGRLDEGERAWREGLSRQPTYSGLVLGYINYLYRTGQIDAVRRLMRQASVANVAADTIMRGRDDSPAIWTGEQDLAGKTIFVNRAGGYGDVLHYSRFAACFKALGARVILQTYAPLAPLLRGTGTDETVAPFDAPSPYHYEVGGAQAVFQLRWDWEWSDRTVPYLDVPADASRRWRMRFDTRRFNVGIAWRSLDAGTRNGYRFRSAPLAAFETLTRVPDIALHALQVGPGVSEITPEATAWLASNLATECGPFTEAAAAMTALDAIVCVDSSLAHLAGALGRPAFILLPRHPDPRWLTDAPGFAPHVCPWYPSARQYRQTRPGEWQAPMEAIASELAVLRMRLNDRITASSVA